MLNGDPWYTYVVKIETAITAVWSSCSRLRVLNKTDTPLHKYPIKNEVTGQWIAVDVQPHASREYYA